MHGFVCLCESFFKKTVLKILEKSLNFEKSLKFQKFENEFEKILKKKEKPQNPNPLSPSLSSFHGPAARSGPLPFPFLYSQTRTRRLPAQLLLPARLSCAAQLHLFPPSSLTDRPGPLVRVIPFLRSAPPFLCFEHPVPPPATCSASPAPSLLQAPIKEH
jgi:hypothetical protein